MSTLLVLAGGAGSGLWQLQCVCVCVCVGGGGGGGGGGIFNTEGQAINILLTTPRITLLLVCTRRRLLYIYSRYPRL